MDPTTISGFRTLCFGTLMAVYLLIFIGGIVRTTGSGMGCPDWPKCFGSWAPPSSVDELPSNYKAIFAAARERKNIKFAKYLRAFGLKQTADRIIADTAVQTETEFNVTRAWIEYGNRVVGVVIGFLILAVAWRSRAFRRTLPALFYLSIATLLAVIVQGWFGSIVVSTNLTTWTITLHMFIALLIVGLLIRLTTIAPLSHEGPDTVGGKTWLAACMTILLIQILLGTNVRSAVDEISSWLPRSQWLEAIGARFIVHRSFSIAVLVLHVLLFLKLNKTMASKALPRALLMIILGALLTGVGMAWLDVPALLQPLHLLLATIAFGIELFLFFELNPRQTSSLQPHYDLI